MKNRKGFTLVELLAALVVLGLIMGIAVTNVVGMVRRQKNNAYVEDAKRMIVRARTTFSTDDSITKATNTCFSLEYLDNGDFDEPPNGGVYLRKSSFVRYEVVPGTGKERYYAYLVECIDCKKGDEKNSYNPSDDKMKKLGGINGQEYSLLKTSSNIDSLITSSFPTETVYGMSVKEDGVTFIKFPSSVCDADKTYIALPDNSSDDGD